MVSFMLAGALLVGNIVEARGSKTLVQVGNVTYTVPTSSLRPFNRKK